MKYQSILQIGAGGTGAILAPLLARLAAHHDSLKCPLTIADGDTYELKNKNRQPMAEKHIGSNKAERLVLLCQEQGIDTVEAHDDYVNEDYFSRYLAHQERVMVVVSVDNNATRKLTLDMLDRSDADFFWVSPANADDEAGDAPIKGQILWWGRQGVNETGINPAGFYPAIENPDGFIPEKDGCAEHMPSHPQLLAANALAASWCLAVIQNHLDARLPKENHALFFDARNPRFALA